MTSHLEALAVLGALVGDVDAFVDLHWTRRPLLRQRAIRPTDLLSFDTVDQLLTTTVLQCPAQMRMARDGKILDPTAFGRYAVESASVPSSLVVDPAAVVDHYVNGATILLQALHNICPPVGALCEALDVALTHGTTAVAVLTPPNSQGLPRHFDGYDVFVVQIEGCKRWTLHRPLDGFAISGSTDPRPDAGPADLVVDLAPGDVLYVPQGWLHEVRSHQEASLHISVMVSHGRWFDVMRPLLERLQALPAMREPLPLGYAHQPDRLTDELIQRLQACATWLTSQDGDGLVQRAAVDFWGNRRTTSRRRLVDAVRADGLRPDTVVRGRGGAALRLVEQPGTVCMSLGQRSITMPNAFGPVLRRLASGTPVRVCELQGMIAEDLRMPLVRQLLREGYLELVGAVNGDDAAADADAAYQHDAVEERAAERAEGSMADMLFDGLLRWTAGEGRADPTSAWPDQPSWLGQQVRVERSGRSGRFGRLFDFPTFESLLLRHHRDRAGADAAGRPRERVQLELRSATVPSELLHRSMDLPGGELAVLDVEKFSNLLADGAVATILNADELTAALSDLTSALATALGLPASLRAVGNTVVSSGDDDPTPNHRFLFQLTGERRWTFADGDEPVSLGAGDVAYVPPGAHSSWTDVEAPALHLVVDVADPVPADPLAWLDLASEDLAALREDVPVGGPADEQRRYLDRLRGALVEANRQRSGS